MAGKPKANQVLLKPGMITIAAVLMWSARHEPDSFSAASTGVWLMGALTTALLVRAAMALAAPLIGLAGAVLGQALRVMQNEAEP